MLRVVVRQSQSRDSGNLRMASKSRETISDMNTNKSRNQECKCEGRIPSWTRSPGSILDLLMVVSNGNSFGECWLGYSRKIRSWSAGNSPGVGGSNIHFRTSSVTCYRL